MSNVIDSWEISGAQWKLPYAFFVTLEKDEDVHPTKDYDCYSSEDVKAWEHGDWEFVILCVTPVTNTHNHSVVHNGAESVLGGVEWGDLHKGHVGRSELNQSHIEDLAREASDLMTSLEKEREKRVNG